MSTSKILFILYVCILWVDEMMFSQSIKWYFPSHFSMFPVLTATQKLVRLQHCRRNKMQSITCTDSTCPHISSHIFICYSFPRLPWTCCQTFIKFHMFPPSAAYWLFKVSTLVMREISLLSLSAANHFWLGQEQEAPGLSGACTHTFTHLHTHTRIWQPGQEWGTMAVISDISPDSRYPNLCTWLGTAYHCGPFRHTCLDRWMEWRETEGEPVSLDALPKRHGRKEGGGWEDREGEAERAGELNHLDVPWWRDRDSQDKWKEERLTWETEEPIESRQRQPQRWCPVCIKPSVSGNWPVTSRTLTSLETVCHSIHLNSSFSRLLSLNLSVSQAGPRGKEPLGPLFWRLEYVRIVT